MTRLWLLAACALALPACKGSKSTPTTASASASVNAVASASATDSASTTPPIASAGSKAFACTVSTPVSIDKTARADAGLTMVTLGKGRVAIGYATGQGTPTVVIVDRDGKTTPAVVDAKDSFGKAPEEKGTHRTVWRVTPIKESNAKISVAYDRLEETPISDAISVPLRALACGPSNGPFIKRDNVSYYDAVATGTADPKAIEAIEPRECRSFSDGSSSWIVTSWMSSNKKLTAFESALGLEGKMTPEHTTHEHFIDAEEIAPLKNKKPPKPILYEAFASVHVPGGGYVVAARYQGKIIVAKRNAAFDADGEPQKFALGNVPGLTSLAVVGDNIALLVPSIGKVEVHGSTFAKNAVPKKPEVITIDEATPPTEGDRTSLSSVATDDGNIFLGFVDGKGTKHKARFAILAGDLASTKVQAMDISTDASNVVELHAASLSGQRYFVSYMDMSGTKPELFGALVTCQ